MIICVKSKNLNEERRDSLDSCCQTPSDWKEPKNYDINNLLQDASTEQSSKNARKKKKSTSFRVIDESGPIEEEAIGNNWQSIT